MPVSRDVLRVTGGKTGGYRDVVFSCCCALERVVLLFPLFERVVLLSLAGRTCCSSFPLFRTCCASLSTFKRVLHLFPPSGICCPSPFAHQNVLSFSFRILVVHVPTFGYLGMITDTGRHEDLAAFGVLGS